MHRKTCLSSKKLNEEVPVLYDKITRIETEVELRIQKLKKNSKKEKCEHLCFHEEIEPYNPNINYYDKYWKRFMLNEIAKKEIKVLEKDVQQFQKKLKKIDSLFKKRQQELKAFTNKSNSAYDICEYSCESCLKKFKEKQKLHSHIKVKHCETEEEQQKQRNMNPQFVFYGSSE